ncbi:MAG: phosphotyrosine protein phosphatase [Pseudomonadota bacterium]
MTPQTIADPAPAIPGIRGAIADRFGSERGLVRLALATAEQRVGLLKETRDINWARVERLVYVCQGNICRSAYAHVLSANEGVPVASFGLATSADRPADTLAIERAHARGVSLDDHRATRVEDFAFQTGDLLIAMEPRQIRKLRAREDTAPQMRTLLGLYCKPRFAHLHDPYEQSPRYFDNCFSRIDRAVARIHQLWQASRPSR